MFVETATLPYGARQRGQAAVGLALVAHHNPAGVFPSAETEPAVDRDRERARDLGRRVLARFLPAMGAMTAFYGADPHERPIRDRTLDLFVAAGTPADVGRGVDRLVAAGAHTITFSGRLGADPRWAIEALGDIVAARG